MPEQAQITDLDPKYFTLSDYDNVRISLPAKPPMTEEDVDAQLFEYVVSGGRSIQSIADLDDAWVQANFEGMSTIAEVRDAIKDRYDRDLDYALSDIKFQACCDALITRLEGDVDDDTLAANVEVVRAANLERLKEMHVSFEQYLREEGLTPEQYDEKVRAETLRSMKLNVALDLMADVLGMQVGNHEITEYLTAPDPEAFLREIRDNGQVENARRAAVRVKAMRRVVDTAIVDAEGENASVAAQPVAAPDPNDGAMPDFAHLPAPRIRDDNPERLTIIPE